MNLSSQCKRSYSLLLTAALLLTALFPAVNFGGGQAYAAGTALAESPAAVPDAATVQLATYSDQDFKLRVLHTNDTHGHLEYVAKRISAIKSERTGNSILLDAGDVFSGTLYFTKFEGLADLEFMNYIGYDAMTFGNHEFDKGLPALKTFMDGASFPFVSANIDFTTKNSELAGLYHNETGLIGDPGTPAKNGNIYPTVIKDVYDEKVGIIGLTTEETVGLSSPGDTITFENYKTSAEKAVSMLQAKGINKIIALSHLGYNIDQQLAVEVPAIDIIVGGHTHTKLDVPVEVPHGSTGDTTLIVQTGEYGQNLGELDVSFNTGGQLTSFSGRLLDIAKYAEDTEAKSMLAPYDAQLEAVRQTVVGNTYTDLYTHRMIDGKSVRVVRQEETPIGNLIADSINSKSTELVSKLLSPSELSSIKGFVAIQNGGGIRAPINQGDITLGEVLTTLPFNNSLVALKVTGKEIISSLENGVSGLEADQGRFPQVSGMRYTFDSAKQPEIVDPASNAVKQEGKRIVSVEIKQPDGSYAPVDPEGYYILSTNSFMAGGGDFYRALAGAKADGRYYELYVPDYEVFNEYLGKIGQVNIGLEGRITNLKGAAASPAPGSGGGTVTAPTPTPSASPAPTPSASGVPAQVTTLTPEDLTQRLAALPAGSSELVIPITASAGGAEVVLPGSALIQQAAATPELVLTFDTGLASYSLPLSVLNGTAITTQLGTGDFTVTVAIKPADAATTAGVNQAAAKQGSLTLAAPVIQFSVTAKAGNRSVPVNRFGSKYVERTIQAGRSLDNKTATGVVYDPDTGALSFVPSVFTTNADGTAKVTIKRASNSYYTVVESSKTFGDLTGHWAKSSIDLLASKLIANGNDTGAFSPSKAVTRAEFAALITRALGLEAVDGTADFTDVSPSKWYAGAIRTASAAGLISGYPNGSFHPDSPITRQEIAAILSKATKHTGTSLPGQMETLGIFKDSSAIAVWSRKSAAEMAAAGIIQGTPDGFFAPGQTATRAEAAVMLEKTLKVLKFIN
ncbi:2',3'-cyclic-nucleotide 2'-phosphodiesterase/5'-or 3'-nucleotidase, 5'-nucleotidase family [Paenibacillus sophorae]|uniref:2',3'-cyclic-nucleotide 2'-phosphodiesterase/5'-or 3'-nucleotidase, 5'-nucleotidase family n=1 Tax=Paenibacillus sophorae TaxID=1333845 RepID=A0A1H8PMJ9_9BACL|nr:S-layer homology domain-containing protein [Paenibacillus sophorae]QWU16632.1 S-layer homology domain-containing protein [Paenibacillus sophorae]SEO43202.1 2',3'-cyclic-nucleotide 2'-phosphodiesterase/5'-or 3'-nucleotidase, 5'-nucleotidase family [Paenibacillus sophorae]